ncbi:MAG: hypothetical protein A2161_17150 [Candidatus Schekmanbacteria bacterium RBG_13_48_7]|uniref:Histidine kinase domain-containing protein n=1 Tax=Candidatus Schekmanbacteria bacterium RBG_13_48_7 TaxID=1817878 RepID=A0A1F7S2D3_9BACT|nr:MAG: hypothetical protein A2161_17150 [Candidatus Schekmanbacteria bacterium RBG_13_48_7]
MIFSRILDSSYLFALNPTNPAVIPVVLISTVLCVGIPLKIWNNTRIEIKLKERETQLLRSRYEVLKSQINPHFLFNTLNSIASLIRTNPEEARDIIVKLSSVLRTLLKERRNLVSVEEELDLIDKYLAIEKSRFGRDRLKVIQEIDPDSREILIPAMILQPLVENAIKHGISKKIGGGTIKIRIKKNEGYLFCEVVDDGVGTELKDENDMLDRGIGLNNIKERLKMVYGDRFRFHIDSNIDDGTDVRIEVPVKPETPQLVE